MKQLERERTITEPIAVSMQKEMAKRSNAESNTASAVAASSSSNGGRFLQPTKSSMMRAKSSIQGHVMRHGVSVQDGR